MWSKEKGSSSVIYGKRRIRGYEAGGVHHLDRVTAWPQVHWRGQWQRHDTGDAGGTLSPFVTAARPSAHENSRSSPFPAPPSILKALIHPQPRLFSLSYVITPITSPFFPTLTPLFLSSFPITLLLFLFTLMTPHTSDPRFTLSILRVCLLPMISQSHFCSALCSWIWFTQTPLPILAPLSPIPFPLQNHPWYLFDCHPPEERWKSILPPATASLWLRRKGRQLAGL